MWGFLKLVSVDTETCWNSNEYVINIHSMVHKCWLISGGRWNLFLRSEEM